ncbi:hypothetical protein [Phycicoccus avicenniae]|uniref:hypothetical protein n=1 Tax=Phycicoccus avicenniae TaxID=2828860 RepID=UPI003D2DF9B8
MGTPENPHAGQGPVPLDIGGDVGALVVTMPDGRPDLEGLEVEIRPAGAAAPTHHHHDGHHHHAHGGHDHARSPFPHVGVVGRPTPAGTVHCLVYPAVTAGDYVLCPMPGDTVALTATVVGGEVTELEWPG